MNTAKARLQALGLLDRSFKNATDDELNASIEALGEDHRAALDDLVKAEAAAVVVREAITRGRIDGTMESVALLITDACLADCIEKLGDNADHPTSEQLREVLPGLVERHTKSITQIMLASTVVGEAPASAIIRDLLKNDDDYKLPPAEPSAGTPLLKRDDNDAERAALKEKRKEAKRLKQEEARIRREQAKAARGR